MTRYKAIAMSDGFWWSGAHKLTSWQIPPFVHRTTKPTTNNCGPRGSYVGGVVVTGDTTVATDSTFNNRIFRGDVVVNAGVTVTFNDCWFESRPGFRRQGLFTSNLTTTGQITMNFCYIGAGRPDGTADSSHYGKNCHNGNRLTATRCIFANATDMFQTATYHDVSVTDSVLGPWTLHTDDSDHSSDTRFPNVTHNDIIQLEGGSNLTFDGNTFLGYFSTAYGGRTAEPTVNVLDSLITPVGKPAIRIDDIFPEHQFGKPVFVKITDGPTSNVQIIHNWMEGGELLMQVSAGGGEGGTSTLTFANNKIIPNQTGFTKVDGTHFTPSIITIDDVNLVNITGLGHNGTETNVYANDPRIAVAFRGVAIDPPSVSGNTRNFRAQAGVLL